MARLRIINQYGNSLAIKLEPADITDFGIIKGDKVDIEDMFLTQKTTKGGKTKCQAKD